MEGSKLNVERLRSLRERKNLSQGEAAKRIGIVRTTYSNYEAGNREPDNETLRRIADFYDFTIDYLLGGAKKENTKKQQLLDEIDNAFDAMTKADQEHLLYFIKKMTENNK
jgi:transcriptional regulator with XRE-family HTH domain